MQHESRRRGVGLALLAAILFGLSTPLAKGLVGEVQPQLLAGLLYLGSGLGLGLLWLVARRQRQGAETPLTRHDAPWLAGAVLAGGVLGPLLLMLGLARTAASGASLLLNLEGVFTALLAWFVFHENFDRRIAVGMAAIVGGGMLLSWPGEVRLGSAGGMLLVVAACFAWGLDNNLTQRVAASDPVQTTALKGLAAGAVNVTVALGLGAMWPGAARVAAAMALGLVSYGVSLVLYVRALRALGTARTGAYFAVAPFVGAAASLAVWDDPVTPPLLAAAALMAGGVWLHLSERHQHEHMHEALVHAHPHVHDEHHHHVHGRNDPPVTDPKPHTHLHQHEPLVHTHPHYPDLHHRHRH
jgi:drug/metabolite transporter (DMT)-like permease